MRDIVEKQRQFFNSNHTKDLDWRLDQLKKLRKVIKDNEDSLYQAIYADFQKSAFDTYTTELSFLYIDIDESLRKLKSWAKSKRVKTNWVNFPARSYVLPEPLGVTLVISAWNYPLQLSLLPAIAAISAGNTVVIKPSECAAQCSRALAQLINQNFDPAFLKVVEGGVAETTELLAQRWDKIFFTGSVAVGKVVYQAAAQHLTPVTLELGGKSPALVLEDCHLHMTVKRLVWAKFLNAGQTCIAPDYVLVPKAMEHKFMERVKEEIASQHFSVANGNYVQIINSKNLQRLVQVVNKEKVFCGGTFNEETRIMEPTVMHGVGFEDAVMQSEIFGPILPVIAYDNLDACIAKIKEREKPLSCYVFTANRATKNKILNEISFGNGAVNDAMMQISNTQLPFGGVGQSGIGAYHGEHGFRTFSHFKSILEKSTLVELELKYYPHSTSKMKWIKRFLGLK